MPPFDETAESANEKIALIADRLDGIRKFWQGQGLGWAPQCAADILRAARLDRLVELARLLAIWTTPPAENIEGNLILAWANLGSLVEGTLKWFLSVYAHTYNAEPVLSPQGAEIAPDELFFVRLCEFFGRKVWCPSDKPRWSSYVDMIRRRRNAIHSYRDCDIGTHQDFLNAIGEYEALLDELDSRVPYP